MSSDEAGAARRSPEPEERSTTNTVVRGAGAFYGDAVASTVIAYLLTGPALFAGIGWLLGRPFGVVWPALVGMLVGMALAIYVIWVRYGRGEQ